MISLASYPINLLVLLVGGLFGSFLNVVIARIPRGESIVFPGSHCPRCLGPVLAQDNIPLVSYVLLDARCRHCRAPISLRYPLVEAAAMGAALYFFAIDGLSPGLAIHLVFFLGLLGLALIDLDTWLLPHALTWPLIAFGLATSFADPGVGWKASLWGAGLGMGGFALVRWLGGLILKKEALGGGDIFLLGAIGAFEGYRALLPVVFLASLQGSIVGLTLLALGRARQQPAPDGWVPPERALPFGPFLSLAALEWLLFGARFSHFPLLG